MTVHFSDNVTLPQLDIIHTCQENKEVYLRFVGHLRKVPVSRVEIKILSSIQFTADMMDCSDAHIAKLLVDMGLRAPRLAFPHAFLDFMDAALMRRGWDVGAPSDAMVELQEQWFESYPQEDLQMRSFRHIHNVMQEEVFY